MDNSCDYLGVEELQELHGGVWEWVLVMVDAKASTIFFGR